MEDGSRQLSIPNLWEQASDGKVPEDAPVPSAKAHRANLQRIDHWLEARELSANTKKAYRRWVLDFANWVNKPWHEVKIRDVDRYKYDLARRQNNLTGGQLSTDTRRQALAGVRSFFNWLELREYIARNPCRVIEMPKAAPAQPRDLGREAVEKLFAALEHRGDRQVRDRAILWMLAHGLRISEVQNLNVGDYDGDRVHIRQAKAGSVGEVPLLKEAIAAMDDWLVWRRSREYDADIQSPLFLSFSSNSSGQRLKHDGIRMMFKELGRLAGLVSVHPHQMRHEFGTWLIDQGLDPLYVQVLLRHRTSTMTKRYTEQVLRHRAAREFRKILTC